MIAPKRLEKIKSLLLEKKIVDIPTLKDILKVTDVTIRKDLDKLEQEGFLKKTYGGAVLFEDKEKENPASIDTIENNIPHHALKEKVAETAISYVNSNNSIFLGGGSTCYLFGKKLKDKEGVTIVSNNISAVNYLSPHLSNIFLIGGETINYNGTSYSGGPKSYNYLNGIYVDKAFISVDGINLSAGFTANSASQLEIFQHLPLFSNEIIILADFTKFNKTSIYQIGPINFADCLVSNEKAHELYKEELFKNNIKFLTSYDL